MVAAARGAPAGTDEKDEEDEEAVVTTVSAPSTPAQSQARPVRRKARVPDACKDSMYYEKRKRNNLAAKRYREKKRQARERAAALALSG